MARLDNTRPQNIEQGLGVHYPSYIHGTTGEHASQCSDPYSCNPHFRQQWVSCTSTSDLITFRLCFHSGCRFRFNFRLRFRLGFPFRLLFRFGFHSRGHFRFSFRLLSPPGPDPQPLNPGPSEFTKKWKTQCVYCFFSGSEATAQCFELGTGK